VQIKIKLEEFDEMSNVI